MNLKVIVRSWVILFFVQIGLVSFAHPAKAGNPTDGTPAIPTGFDPKLARDLMAICTSFTFIDLYGSDAEILPDGYKKIYTSGVFGMDNKYQVYMWGKTAIINIRGSTDKTLSWLENIYGSMIPAKGVIGIPDGKVHYCFAKDTAAAVHSGYALGIALLSGDIIHQIKSLNKDGVSSFIITGHSQGGALAYMLKAFLENGSAPELPKTNTYNVYAFANPMIGNKEFADEFEKRFCGSNNCFSIINPADFVPTLPLSYSEKKLLSKENLSNLLFDRTKFNLKQLAEDAAIHNYENTISHVAKYSGSTLETRISKDVGKVDMPDYVTDINYAQMQTRILLRPFEYPKVLKDAAEIKSMQQKLDTKMKKDSIRQAKKDSIYLAKKGTPRKEGRRQKNDPTVDIYRQEPSGFQHKPYNYYVNFTKLYFPADYEKLKKKYLPENL